MKVNGKNFQINKQCTMAKISCKIYRAKGNSNFDLLVRVSDLHAKYLQGKKSGKLFDL